MNDTAKSVGRPRKHDDPVQISVRLPQWAVDAIDDAAYEMERTVREDTGARVRVSRADVILRMLEERSKDKDK